MKSFLGLLAALLIGWAGAARAEDYPTKPVLIIVPFAAGGPSDVVTRVLADELSKLWNQQVLVDNKAGGGTVVGNNLAARARPDGYTILMVAGAFTTLPGIRTSLPYDTLKDFSGVSLFVDAPLSIIATPGAPFNNLQELIAEAKKRPEDRPLTFASAGIGTTSHMGMELLQRKMGVKFKHVPYTGEAAAMPDALAGRVDFETGTWAFQRPYVESGRMKVLAVLYRDRVAELPNTPTVHEIVPGLGGALDAFNGIVVPAGVPAPVKAKISEGIKTVVTSKAFRDRIVALGSYPRASTPEETDAFLKEQVQTWIDVARQANIKVD